MTKAETAAVIVSIAALMVAVATAVIAYFAYDFQIKSGRKAQEATDKQMAFAEQSAKDSAAETQEALSLTRQSIAMQQRLAEQFGKSAEFTGELAQNAGRSLNHARKIAQISQRAYLEFEIENIPATTLNDIKSESPPQEDLRHPEKYKSIVLVIRNSGNTPASNIVGSYSVYRGVWTDYGPQDGQRQVALTPVSSLTRSSRQQIELLQLQDFEHLVVRGLVRFNDIFGSVYEEKFCFRVLQNEVQICPAADADQ